MEQSRGSNPTRRLRGPLDTRLCVGLTWRAEKSGHSRSPPSPPRFLCPATGARLDYYFSENLLAYFIFYFIYIYIYFCSWPNLQHSAQLTSPSLKIKKFSGLTDARTCKQSIFRCYSTSTLNAVRLGENPFTCRCKKQKQKQHKNPV